METCLPAIVPRSLFLFSSLRRLWALRWGGVLARLYGPGMGPALIAYLPRKAIPTTAPAGSLMGCSGLGVTEVAPGPSRSGRVTFP